jgi:uncharacterized transporter YbjL
VISELVNAVKARISATVQSVIWGALAGLAAIVAIGFFLGALHTWLAERYGSLQASLGIGGGFLLLAIIIGIVLVIMKKRANARIKRQSERLVMPSMSVVTALMSSKMGSKQKSMLVLGALAAGWLIARPRSGRSDD